VSDIFVSYKAEDRRRVRPLVDALEAEGLSVWWDAEIGGGAAWRQSIEAELDSARCVIVIWSKRSTGPAGAFVHDEASRAMERHVYLPVKIDNVRPPLGFGERQALPLSRWQGNRADPRYQAVLHAALAIMEGKAPPAPALGGQGGIDRRLVLAGGAAAIAAAGAGGWFLLRSGSSSAADGIAVMPFANLSGDPAQAYFSDGIAEELRNSLSRIPGLKVVARASSEAVRNDDLKAAASKLGVANILTGSVRRSPSMIRIGAQLIGGDDGIERWSQAYDRAPGDTLQIQGDIAARVAEALSIQLGWKDRSAMAEGGTRDPSAQDLLLKARDIVAHDDTGVGLQRALGTIDAAISLDPRYADAISAKASLLATLGGRESRSAAESQAYMQSAERVARHAIELAPRSAAAHGALAKIYMRTLRIGPALKEFAVMASLPGGGPNGGFNNVDEYALALSNAGLSDAAIDRSRQMIAQDPLNPFAYVTMAVSFEGLRQFKEADNVTLKAMSLAPDLMWPRAVHGYYLMLLGDLDGSAAVFASLPPNAVLAAWQIVLQQKRGNRAEASKLLAQIQRTYGDAGHYQYAQIFAQLGERDQAIAALEKAWIARDPGLSAILGDPLLDPVRSDPRFQAIVTRLGFPGH
jgi:serine/threonine-protein kinase